MPKSDILQPNLVYGQNIDSKQEVVTQVRKKISNNMALIYKAGVKISSDFNK